MPGVLDRTIPNCEQSATMIAAARGGHATPRRTLPMPAPNRGPAHRSDADADGMPSGGRTVRALACGPAGPPSAVSATRPIASRTLGLRGEIQCRARIEAVYRLEIVEAAFDDRTVRVHWPKWVPSALRAQAVETVTRQAISCKIRSMTVAPMMVQPAETGIQCTRSSGLTLHTIPSQRRR